MAVSWVVADTNVVLIHQNDETQDLRLYGDDALTSALVGIDLDDHDWVVFEVPQAGDPGFELGF